MRTPAISHHWIQIGPFELEIQGRYECDDTQEWFEYFSIKHGDVEVEPEDYFTKKHVDALQQAAIDATKAAAKAQNDESAIDAYIARMAA